jgi:signal transduction histidine kinase
MLNVTGDELIQAMTDAVFVVDPSGVIQSANAAAERVTKRSGAELVGRKISELALADASLSATSIGQGADAMMVVIAHAVDRNETELTRALKDAEKQLELLREQRLRTERLATLGRLAGGVGHELRNIAQLQVLALESLSHEIRGMNYQPHPALADLERTSEQVATHAQRLLKLAHPAPEHTRQVNLAEVVREVLGTLSGAGRLRGIQTELSIGNDELLVAVSKTRIEQVLWNLTLNAVEAIGKAGGTLRVAAHGTAHRRVVVEITDSGSGIAPETLSRIFEPFFTTKAGATGLGLPVAKEIVEGHGGELLVVTTSGTETTFRFDVPRAT